MLKHRRGQSMVEWAILFGIVIAVILTFLNTTFKTRIKQTLQDGTDSMYDMAGRLQNSRPLSP